MSINSLSNRYVNITIANPVTDALVNGQPNRLAVTDQTFNESIINDPSLYDCAITTFQCPLQSIPLFVFPIVPGQSNPNLSTMIIGVCQNVDPSSIPNVVTPVNYSENLIWVPQTYGLPAPSQTSATTQIVTPYHYCYSYEYFIVQSLNVALFTSWTAAGGAGVFGAGTCPYFTYSSETGLISCVMRQKFANTASAGWGWSICWNQALDNFMSNFNTVQSGDYFILQNQDAVTTTDAYSYDTSNVAEGGNYSQNTPAYTKSTALTTYIYTQEYSTSDYLNSVRRIVVTTGSIPIIGEYFPQPNNEYSGTINRIHVLADVIVETAKPGSQRQVFVYKPQIYQMIAMNSTAPLRNISLRFQWVDQQNIFRDIYLSGNDCITAKLGFFPK